MKDTDFIHPDDRSAFYNRVLRIVRLIPAGRVLSYGDVATLAGAHRAARAVGAILKHTPHRDLPWQRVVNSQMRVSGGGTGERALLQVQILQAEGLSFDSSGRIDTPDVRWPLDEAHQALEDDLGYRL